jgi:hypothetical protein
VKQFFSRKINWIYVLILAVVSVSLVFTNIGYDSEYQLAMAYRIIKGDLPVVQMWEPNQTSVFLCAILMKIYMTVTNTTTGIVLYTQIVGLLIRGSICLFLFKAISKYTCRAAAAAAAALYFLTAPKDLLTPEYSNMQLWFGTLLFLSLLQYFDKRQKRFLLLSAVSLCLGIFSYPSFAIVYFIVLIILYKYSEHFLRDAAIVTGVCAVIGGLFLCYLFSLADLDTLVKCVVSALNVEPTHTVSLSGKLLEHCKNILLCCLFLTLVTFIAFAAERLMRLFIPSYKNKCTESSFRHNALFIGWFILLVLFVINIFSVENRNAYTILTMYMTAIGFFYMKNLVGAERRTYTAAFLIAIGNLVATLILSNHDFIQDAPYAMLIYCVSALPLYKLYLGIRDNRRMQKTYKICVYAFLFLLAFRCVYIHVPITGRGQISAIIEDYAFIRSGPAIGIYTNQEGAARQRDSMEEWEEYINDGDKIWILGEPVDTLGYLYKDVDVAAPSVISNPSYNEALLYYWELNPDKYPDVIILSSGFGELSWDLLKNNWLMDWIDEEYKPATVVDGNYWRYYYREERSFE